MSAGPASEPSALRTAHPGPFDRGTYDQALKALTASRRRHAATKTRLILAAPRPESWKLSSGSRTWSATGARQPRLTSPARAGIQRLYMAGSALAFDANRIGVNQILAVKTGPRGTSGMPRVRHYTEPARLAARQ
jgi:hypothetical protein